MAAYESVLSIIEREQLTYHKDSNYTILCPQGIKVALLDECIYVKS
jgi:hypothetical protein